MSSPWSLLLPELYTLIASTLPIRARINLKRACRQNYKWEKEELWIPRKLISPAHLNDLIHYLRCPYLDDDEKLAYTRFCTAMKDLLRFGLLDLLWNNRFNATLGYPITVYPLSKVVGPPLVRLFGIYWDLSGAPMHSIVLVELQCRAGGWQVITKDQQGQCKFITPAPSSLVQAISSLGRTNAAALLSEHVLYPKTLEE